MEPHYKGSKLLGVKGQIFCEMAADKEGLPQSSDQVILLVDRDFTNLEGQQQSMANNDEVSPGHHIQQWEFIFLSRQSLEQWKWKKQHLLLGWQKHTK